MKHTEFSNYGQTGVSRDEPQLAGLSVVEITKAFHQRQVLNGISLEVRPGEIVGLFGRDGAGKTVTFYSIVGLVKPDSGRVMLNGQDITHLPLYRRALLGLGYLPQESSVFWGLTVAQNVMAVLEMVEPDTAIATRRLDELLNSFQIGHLRNRPVKSLSGGERRRCEVAKALALDPSVLLLDEPFAGIDPLTIANIKRLVREVKNCNIGVLISDQDIPDMFELIDRAYVIHEGSIIFHGDSTQMLADENVRAMYLGREFSLQGRDRIDLPA